MDDLNYLSTLSNLEKATANYRRMREAAARRVEMNREAAGKLRSLAGEMTVSGADVHRISDDVLDIAGQLEKPD